VTLKKDSVQIENVDFSDAYEKAVEDAARAEADVKKNRQQLESVKVEAEKTAAQAKGAAKAAKAAAEGMKANGRSAEAFAIERKAEALRKSPAAVELIQAEAQRAAVEKWDGHLPQQFVPGSALPFLGLAGHK